MRKATIRFFMSVCFYVCKYVFIYVCIYVCMYTCVCVRPSAWNNPVPTARIIIEFGILGFLENCGGSSTFFKILQVHRVRYMKVKKVNQFRY